MQVDANDVVDALLSQVVQLSRDLAIARATIVARDRELTDAKAAVADLQQAPNEASDD